jgi:taurine dioxygenase
MAEPDWKLTPLTGAFGAEVDLDLNEVEDGAALMALLEEHLVLVFRDQHLSHAAQSRIAHAMGEPTPAHPVVPGHPDFPEMLILEAAAGGKNARWHTDVTFVPTPPAASVLVGEIIPPFGGDTCWSDTRTAFERLNSSIQAAIVDLEAVHRIAPLAYWGEPFDTALSREDADALFEAAKDVPPVIHPVVRIHPSTGLPSLFVNPGFTTHLVGCSRIESEYLLKLLFEHMVQPELTLRHHWRQGDVVMWDNRATSHYAVDDYGDQPRRMRRITLRGSLPFGPTGTESRIAEDPLVAVR